MNAANIYLSGINLTKCKYNHRSFQAGVYSHPANGVGGDLIPWEAFQREQSLKWQNLNNRRKGIKRKAKKEKRERQKRKGEDKKYLFVIIIVRSFLIWATASSDVQRNIHVM